mmetsp:Transcript_38672/g.76001  ORF Transcript_38672/g.76001 Transcript_38672/m.76001 type:complete len:98 (+) Transcript_38672:829-1122(+)
MLRRLCTNYGSPSWKIVRERRDRIILPGPPQVHVAVGIAPQSQLLRLRHLVLPSKQSPSLQKLMKHRKKSHKVPVRLIRHSKENASLRRLLRREKKF